MKKVAANDDNFFVFEDTMHQVLYKISPTDISDKEGV